jgi:hypothetical protein
MQVMMIMMFSFAMSIGVCLRRRNVLYVVMLTLLSLTLWSLFLLGNLWER